MKQSSFARIPFSAKQLPFFYGWVIIFVGTLGVLMSAPGQTIGLSTFTDSLIEVLSISRDRLSLAYMIGTILSSLLLTRAGKIYDRYGVRPLAVAASVGLAIGLLYLSQIDVLVQNSLRFLGTSKVQWITFVALFLGFLMIRFWGQGVLTLVSRTMMMKWFDERRGLALGFSNVVMAWGFSYAPIVFEYLIQSHGWRLAWQYIAVSLVLVFPIIIFLFFRNDPSDVGLSPDGQFKSKKRQKITRFPVVKDFVLAEARHSFSFWVFAVAVAMTALYNTGFTFHVISIFEEVNIDRSKAIRIFQWIALVSISFTLILSVLSDYIKMKYLLFANSIAALFAILGFVFLDKSVIAYWALVIGNGLLTSLYAVISAMVWARFFGKTHLGAIVGQVMMLTVFGSAIGPILFSQSLSALGSYHWAAWLCLICYLLVGFCGFWVKNPQVAQR
ncbi:MAG: MFS transporter [Bacteroidota bacterium]